MVSGFLVVLGEQFFSGLVGSSGNGRAALAPLDDADFQMWYWHLLSEQVLESFRIVW